ncbi:hypothetical protein [Marinomonas ostreistagni]|uniref:hypothetical protein n=1 Tax=Marinomonas ostreistagni TaxID=359209 RepID=UPI001951D448|nr:hypothetical protein [Marinomonas ostreistagni]MBM6549617.1 hypothetical protein [Marinomonas ostreistagni]
MSNKTLVEMINDIDTSYLTEQEKQEAVARARAAEYTVELLHSAFTWVKTQLVGKRVPFNPTKQSHA